jgi:hypothetical protein
MLQIFTNRWLWDIPRRDSVQLFQPGLSWRARTQRQMALAGVPVRYNKSFSVIRQYGPIFATSHGGIQYDCGASGGSFPKFIYSVLFIYN